MMSSIAVQRLLEKAAYRWPDSLSVTYEGQSFSWRQTYDRTLRLAWGLAGKGIRAGDRIAYLGFNSHWCFELFYAAPMAGAIVVPINFRLSVGEMIACVEDAEPTVLVIDQHHMPQAAGIVHACPWLKTVIYAGNENTPWDMVSYELLIEVAKETPLTPSSGDETLVIFYTGGTTGRSKGVMLTHNNQFTNALGGVSWYQMTERETHLLSSPMFHAAAGSRVYTSTMTGTHSVILSRFDAKKVLESAKRYRVNTMQIVPTMLQMLLDHPDYSASSLSSLRLITYGASPMPVALMERALAVLPGVSFAQSYGMTEASPVVTVLNGEDHINGARDTKRLESVGRPVFHNDVRIVDKKRRTLPFGDVGEIAVRGSNVMKGYWRAPEQTAAVLKDGWYYTGDSGYLDESGYLFVAGRIKDMIVSGGENVYPIEIENILSRHPAVKECAVIGMPHETWGESVHAVVRLVDTHRVTEDDIIQYCRTRIAHYKCPRSVTIMEKAFPVSAVNKILKNKLREQLIQENG